ncbi:carboxymuconolactone decarboxylase family protein [Nakamurella sp. A5-74]|uniref:Carboxymuconolactone decarboxylase family protein n=1 Tax=Nakamurella sp. A5-74 TaxID=3158264 RepID=A0AAU8DU03_9ACTN
MTAATSRPTSLTPSTGVPSADRLSRARVPLDPPRGLVARLAAWYSRRRFGQVMEPALALAHQPRALLADLAFESLLQRCRSLDPGLSALATLSVAVDIECSWCLDFGYLEAHHRLVDPAKLRDLPVWQESEVYTPVERRVLGYAVAMTATPPVVTDEQAVALRTDLGDAAFVELTMMVAVENQRSRINAALGLVSQGFSESCRVPR